jgi:F-type H+-transporting ATPase subunit gamma
MANQRDIKRRIESVRSTQKITRAMKMVAAAKLRRAQETIVKTRPYAFRMRELVHNLALRASAGAHPLLRAANGTGTIDLVVVTSDRGLCGGFNSSLVQEAMRLLRGQFAGRDVQLTVVGRKGIDMLKRRPCTIRKTLRNIADRPLLRSAQEIVQDTMTRFASGQVDEVYCLYNEFKSAIAQRVTLERLLPFEPSTDQGVMVTDFLYEPSVEAVFETLLTQHLDVQMHRVLAESSASEHGARMTAMESATDNAGDVIAALTLEYNRVRQDAITTELIEVVSGAAAL